MKVYMKTGDIRLTNSQVAPRLIIAAVFIAVSMIFLNLIFNSGKSFGEILISYGFMVLPIVIMLFAVSIFMVVGYFIPPRPYKAKLVIKRNETYANKQITYMTFIAENELGNDEGNLIPTEYYCYTIGENNLVIGNNYALKIKEFNWIPKYVEELSNATKVKEKIPTPSWIPFLFVGILSLIGLVLAVLALKGFIK